MFKGLENLYRVQCVWSMDLKQWEVVKYNLLEKEGGFHHDGFKS